MDRVDQAIASADEDCLAPGWAPEAEAAIGVIVRELRAQCFIHAADWLEHEVKQ